MPQAHRRHKPRNFAQLELPLAHVPPVIRTHGLRAAHVAPLVGRKHANGFWSGRVPASHAWAFPYIVIADAGSTWATLTFDCDDPLTMESGLADLSPWNWLVETTRGAHVTWALAVPVAKHANARAAPERFLARVAEYYHAKLGADPAFGGLGRNPAHPDARVTWGAVEPYHLDTAASVIPFNWKRPRIALTGIGRNVDLFRTGMRWAGRQENAGLPVLAALHAVNEEIAASHGRWALPDSEVGTIARSIERFRAKWSRRGWHAPEWLNLQAARGRKGKGVPRQASLFDDATNEAVKPWEAEGISRAWWYRRRQASLPDDAPSETAKPWEAEGISRAWWYRRRQRAASEE